MPSQRRRRTQRRFSQRGESSRTGCCRVGPGAGHTGPHRRPASDPPGAAPANADPGQAAPGPDGSGGGQLGAGSVGQSNQGTVGYGGGQPAYGGYDPAPDPDQGNDYGDRNQPGGFQGEDVGPIVLDLSGQGIALTQLTSSNQFVVGEDNYQHRTAWAGAGSAVLFVDPNGDNAIRNADQYVFSDWDPSASSDMEALRDVFDTNHDGKLDAGDADFAQFKLMVTNPDGTTSVETLAQAGITSIDLQANSVTRSYADGSSIDGETTYTKADGSTGTAASVTLEQVAAGTVLETPLVTHNPDGSTTVDNVTVHPDGSLASETISTTSADGQSKTLAFDDSGNGIIDRRDGGRSEGRDLRGGAGDHGGGLRRRRTPHVRPRSARGRGGRGRMVARLRLERGGARPARACHRSGRLHAERGGRDLARHRRLRVRQERTIPTGIGGPGTRQRRIVRTPAGMVRPLSDRLRRGSTRRRRPPVIKVNQAGTVTEAKAPLDAGRRVGFGTIVSARSGETEDVAIAHLAAGWNAGQLKVGSFARSERMAKWNEVLRIADASEAPYAGAPRRFGQAVVRNSPSLD